MSIKDRANLRRRYRGALLGLAVGDALGTTVEFKPAGSFPPVSEIVGGGQFRLPAGAWTDDTSMALCLAESLVERRGFDPADQLGRYVRWYREGYLSSTGVCFDIGTATASALQRFERTGEQFPGDAFPDAGGNGPLMRLAPVPLVYRGDPAAAISRAADSARTTHGMTQAIDATRYLAALLVGALAGEGVEGLLRSGVVEPVAGLWSSVPLHPDVGSVAQGSFLKREPPAIRGRGYAPGALEAALWALARTSTFRDAVLAAVNLGEDADTTGAICGQLAGAIYGEDAIPLRWRERLAMRERIEQLADSLLELSDALGGTRVNPPGDSFWVTPRRLLAGPYPGSSTDVAAATKLDAFLDVAVTRFVDLTEEGEGPPLRPYAPLLLELADARRIEVAHRRTPIPDLGVPSPLQMRSILAAIDEALAAEQVVYVHCRGGVGRTGTVVACHLVESLGLTGAEALAELAKARAGTARAHRIAPETTEQRAFVTAWRPTPARQAVAHLDCTQET